MVVPTVAGSSIEVEAEVAFGVPRGRPPSWPAARASSIRLPAFELRHCPGSIPGVHYRRLFANGSAPVEATFRRWLSRLSPARRSKLRPKLRSGYPERNFGLNF